MLIETLYSSNDKCFFYSVCSSMNFTLQNPTRFVRETYRVIENIAIHYKNSIKKKKKKQTFITKRFTSFQYIKLFITIRIWY